MLKSIAVSLLLCATLPGNDGLAETSTEEESVRTLLQGILANSWEMHAENEEIAKELWRCDHDLVVRTIARTWRNVDENQSLKLVLILGGIDTAASTKLILEIGAASKGYYRDRMFGELYGRRINIEIPEVARDVLLQDVIGGSIETASIRSQTLAHCEMLHDGAVVPPILTRFLGELENPSQLAGPPDHYETGRAFVLDRFVGSFDALGIRALPFLEEASVLQDGRRTKEWLSLAAFVAGDGKGREQLFKEVLASEDVDFLYLALIHYARELPNDARILTEVVEAKVRLMEKNDGEISESRAFNMLRIGLKSLSAKQDVFNVHNGL